MRTTEFLQQFFKETSGLRLGKHCRDMPVTISPFDGKRGIDGEIGERISSIMLWGNPGRVVLKAHFDLDTAVKWAARGLGQHPDDIEDSVAIDFMREFSNLHAGYLRGMFESKGVQFGISLPFVMAGDSEKTLEELRGPKVAYHAWTLSDGDSSITYTSEIDLTDLSVFETAQASLAADLVEDVAKATSGEQDGEVEFFL